MKTPFLNYDRIAPEYNQRYSSAEPSERGQALLNLARQVKAGDILEVGSGTGYWLNLLHLITPSLYGLDFSMGMLQQAKEQPARLKLARGAATHLPYRDDSFNLIYCVDAIHHFGDQRAFIAEAFRVLRPGGALAIIGNDPHDGTAQWYVYDYFESVLETDLRRYSSAETLLHWMRTGCFQDVSSQNVEHISNVHVGRGVLNDPYLKHNATSQLALLTGGQYQAGIQKINAALAEAEARHESIVFRSDIQVKMYLGCKPA